MEESSTTPWFNLIQNFTEENLCQLKELFAKKPSGLNKIEFEEAICTLYGNSEYSLQSMLLFDEINPDEVEPNLTWTELLNYITKNLNTSDNNKIHLELTTISTIPQTKRESIIKIVLIETDKHFCYAVIAKYGRIGIYDGNLNFLTSYHAIMTREDINRTEDERRRRNRWITDAIFCPDVLMFIVTNTARSLMIYEASGLKHVPCCLILTTPCVVQSLAYKLISQENQSCCLFMGDSNGEIISFQFLQPKFSLFRKKYNDRMSLFYWDELHNEKDYVLIKHHQKRHKNNIQKLRFCNSRNVLISCSRDATVSVMETYFQTKKRPVIFKIIKGVTAFASNSQLKILITGSDDGVLRIFNSVIVSKPICILKDHQSGIIDLQILSSEELFISLSRDAILKLWDIKNFDCLQTINIKFPCFGVQGKTIEWGTDAIYPGPKRIVSGDETSKTNLEINGITEVKTREKEDTNLCYSDKWQRSNILITCCNYIAKIDLKFVDPQIQTSFEAPVLPPPPLQNSVLIPASWRIHASNPLATTTTFGKNEELNLQKSLDGLKFILDKNLLEEHKLNSDINYEIAKLETHKLGMLKNVAQGAPYLALKLYDIEELKLSADLPMPKKKTTKQMIENVQKMLNSTAVKEQIFSESSSSRSKSSRSSLVEFPF